MTFKPYPKEEQLGRGPARPKRVKASKGRWERIAESKQGPCRVCGGAPPNELHHVAPRSQGGGDTEANIVPVCSDCHRRITRYDKEACAALRRSLTDSEYAYANEMLGETRFEARYPVKWENA